MRTLAILAVLQVFISLGLAQSVPPSGMKASLEVSQIQGKSGEPVLLLRIISEGPLPRAFVEHEALNPANYRLYEISLPDEPEMVVKPVDDAFGESAQPILYPDAKTILFSLRHPLSAEKTFIVVIGNFQRLSGKSDRLSARFRLDAAQVAIRNAYLPATELTLQAHDAAVIPPGGRVDVERSILKLSGSSTIEETTETIPATIQPAGEDNYSLTLKKSLAEGKEHSLKVKLQSATIPERQIVAKGKIKPAGAPAKEDDAKIKATLSSVAAVHQKGVFALTANYAPLHNNFYLPGSLWKWDPNLTVDVGLRSTKSNNSVIAAAPFRRVLLLGNETTPAPGTRIPAYSKWARTPWYHLDDVTVALGPRFESDRDFNRLNTVGEAKGEFVFTRWRQSIQAKKDLIATGTDSTGKPLKDRLDSLEGINFGFDLVPYFTVDFGGHVNNETVTNSKAKTSVTVPEHLIFRNNVGLIAKFEYKRVALSIDELLMGLTTTETVAFVTATGVGVRNVHGVQPHNKVTLDVYFDPGKHYAFTLGYENGRMPPNFEYLNKATSGIKVLF